MAEVKDWTKLTIPLLKQELASRNLDVKGKKQDLVDRLELSSQELDTEDDPDKAAVVDISDDDPGLEGEMTEEEGEEDEEVDEEDGGTEPEKEMKNADGEQKEETDGEDMEEETKAEAIDGEDEEEETNEDAIDGEDEEEETKEEAIDGEGTEEEKDDLTDGENVEEEKDIEKEKDELTDGENVEKEDKDELIEGENVEKEVKDELIEGEEEKGEIVDGENTEEDNDELIDGKNVEEKQKENAIDGDNLEKEEKDELHSACLEGENEEEEEKDEIIDGEDEEEEKDEVIDGENSEEEKDELIDGEEEVKESPVEGENEDDKNEEDNKRNDESSNTLVEEEDAPNDQSSEKRATHEEDGDQSPDIIILDDECIDLSYDKLKDDDEDDMDLEEDEEAGGKGKEKLKRFDWATLYIPKVNEIHKDLQNSQQIRVLYIYPITTQMMADPAVNVNFQHCSSMPCKFYPTEKEDGTVFEGYVTLRFEFSEDALAAMEGLSKALPSSVTIKVRQPSQSHQDMLSAFSRSEPQGIEPWMKDNKNTKVVFVGNLPPTATEASLRDIFTGATIIRIAREDDSTSKGYAVMGYDNAKDAEVAAKQHMCAVHHNYVLAVLYLSQDNKRSEGDEEPYVDRTKLLEELKKFEEEIGISAEVKKMPKVTPVAKKDAGSAKKKSSTSQATERNGKSSRRPASSRSSSSSTQRSRTDGRKPSGDKEGEKPRVRASRWSKETEGKGINATELVERLKRKWERESERRGQRERRTGDDEPRQRRQLSWNRQADKRPYHNRDDNMDNKRYRTERSSDAGQMRSHRPRMQSSLDNAFPQQGALGMGGGIGMGMAQGGGMMMAGGMGMGYGMGQEMGYGMMQDGGMGYGMGQDGGMVMGGGMNAVPSLMSNGQQMGSVGGRQQMAGSSQGSGVNPSSGTVNLLLGLTQMLSKQLPQQQQRSTHQLSRDRGFRSRSNRDDSRR